MRRGFKADLHRMFDAAREMTGSMHPEDMHDARRAVSVLERETFELLRELEALRVEKKPLTREEIRQVVREVQAEVARESAPRQ